jgi:hypothetical protein
MAVFARFVTRILTDSGIVTIRSRRIRTLFNVMIFHLQLKIDKIHIIIMNKVSSFVNKVNVIIQVRSVSSFKFVILGYFIFPFVPFGSGYFYANPK